MFAISNTDNNWFEFLRNAQLNSSVNFWNPTPWRVRSINKGEKWFFMLKSPIRKIGGFGEFVEYKELTPSDAWNEFGHRNGFEVKDEFVSAIQQYLNKHSEAHRGIPINIETYKIGCVVLTNCQFWDSDRYISPEDFNIKFPPQIVKFKVFKGYEPDLFHISNTIGFNLLNEPREDYRSLLKQRRGQGEFKGKILKAYNNKCCISGEACPELLEAAHIQPYSSINSNHVQNGILLRVDLHRLYDNGLIFIDKDYIVHISSRIKTAMYHMFNGVQIMLPKDMDCYPLKESLELRRNDFRE